MYRELLIAFIIGSSWFVFLPYFIGFYAYKGRFSPNRCLREPYDFYTMVAPFVTGFMSMLAILFHMSFNIDIYLSFVLISLLTTILVSTTITACQLYPFTDVRLKEQYIRLTIYHLLTYMSIAVAYLYVV